MKQDRAVFKLLYWSCFYFLSDMGRLQHKCNQLRLLVKCSIASKQNHSVIDYDYLESIHDYICLGTCQKENKTHLHGLM